MRGGDDRRGGQRRSTPEGSRGERAAMPARAERGPRPDDRGPRREDRGPRVRPDETRTVEPAPMMRAEGADDRAAGPMDEGRRRRRGRRGGRGRGPREGVAAGAPGEPMMPMETETFETPMAEPMEAEMAMEMTPREAMRGAEPAASESDAQPMMERAPREERFARGTMERGSREDRGSREERGSRQERSGHGAAAATLEPGLSNEALAEEGRRCTMELLQAMGFEGTVTAKAEDGHVDVTAEVGADDALLTGPKGEVRQALQHLLNRMINRGEGSRYHLQLEINDFWQRREDELRGLATSLANEALEQRTETVTEYLNAQERRIVHMTLKEDARVKTYALGNGMIKRVAIAPADFEAGPRDDD